MFRSSKPEPRHQGRAGRGQNNLTPGRLRQQRKGLWGPSCRVELEPGQLSGADWGGGITSQWRLRPSPPPTPTLCQRIRARGGSRHQTNLRTSNTSLLSFHQISPATASTTTTSSGSPRCWCTKSSLEGERVWDDGGGSGPRQQGGSILHCSAGRRATVAGGGYPLHGTDTRPPNPHQKWTKSGEWNNPLKKSRIIWVIHDVCEHYHSGTGKGNCQRGFSRDWQRWIPPKSFGGKPILSPDTPWGFCSGATYGNHLLHFVLPTKLAAHQFVEDSTRTKTKLLNICKNIFDYFCNSRFLKNGKPKVKLLCTLRSLFLFKQNSRISTSLLGGWGWGVGGV